MIILANFRLADDLSQAEEFLKEALVLKPGAVIFYYLAIFYNFANIPLLVEKLRMVKKSHGNWERKLRKVYIHTLCYSNLLTQEEMWELFEDKNLPNMFRAK